MLRQARWAVRKELGPEVVDANRGQVRLAESFPSDVSLFLALIASGNRDDLKQAVELYEDDLLTGFSLEEASFMEWLATERSRLRDLVLRALDRLMEQGADINPEELLVFAQRAVSIDPYREGAHRHLLRALALMGRRSEDRKSTRLNSRT